MTKLAMIALVSTLLSIVSAAAPASAGMIVSGPRCDGIATMNSRVQLADELKLSTKLGATIDDWNGCLKVSYSDAAGMSHTEFYDPNSMNRIN